MASPPNPRSFPLLLLLFSIFSSSSAAVVLPRRLRCKREHYDSLLQVRTAIIFLNSSNFWLAGTDCCTWAGVTCDSKTGEVTDISLGFVVSRDSYYNLSVKYVPVAIHQIHPALFNITSLRTLKMPGCGISAPLPSGIGKLSSLTVLDLSHNNLSGPSPFPSSITNLTSLTRLKIQDGGLGTLGPLPGFLAQLPSLTELDLSYNSLSGPFPGFIANICSLTKLDLSSSNLSGHLPSFEKLIHLMDLSLENNRLQGSLSSVSLLPKLSRLSGNSFSGPIPALNATSIGFIYLGNNSLTGSIPYSFSKLHNLQVLSLGYNSLDGLIPSFIFKLPSLQVLFLFQNEFSGPLPEEFPGALTSAVRIVGFAGNYLEGPVPQWLFKPPTLETLDLSSNRFNGTVDLSSLSLKTERLFRVSLANNNLTVVASSNASDIIKQSRLDYLNLANCNMTTIPDFLNHVPHLESLHLASNKISGTIPRQLWKLNSISLSHNQFTDLEWPPLDTEMMFLDLSFNKLHGPIPLVSGRAINYSNNNLTHQIPSNISLYVLNTVYLSLSRNNFTGQIPSSICNGTSLEVLDLSYNYLSGPIPDCVVNISSIHVIDLRQNKLTGALPSYFYENCSLRTINVNGNELQGRLPASLVNCKDLEVLDVSNNFLSGPFPHWISEFSKLQVLVLRNNSFSGRLPGQWNAVSFSLLKVMDLSFNYFSGELPSKLFDSLMMRISNTSAASFSVMRYDTKMVSGMYYQDSIAITLKERTFSLDRLLTTFNFMDLSSNKFEGIIPNEMGKLVLLRGLNLSHNQLSGPIPRSFKNLRVLESLDLSYNDLVGEIPTDLTSLTFLAFMNLSYNNLVGEIPQGKQFSTFYKFSYVGNKALCGPPLQECGLMTHTPSTNESKEETREAPWFLISVEVGFLFGLLVWYGTLLFLVEARICFRGLVLKIHRYIH